MERRIIIKQPGSPDVLELEQFDLEAPGPGQARVRHRAIGVNYLDTYHRSGLYPLPMPAALGAEAAGVIEELGPDTAHLGLREGQRVGYVLPTTGSYASARIAPADRLVPLPDSVDDDVAAAVLLKGMTVEFLVRRCFRVKAGDWVLLHAAAGGVGLVACQWLAAIGAQVIGTVGTREKAELAREHGVAHTIVYTEEDFKKRTRELCPGGVAVVYDAVGKSTFEGSLDCLAPRGTLVSFGNASGKPPPLDVLTLSAKGSLYVTRPTLFAYTKTREELLESAGALFDMLTSGRIRPHITRRFPLEAAADAHRALESRDTAGQTLLVP
jgi:NADPH2:quinone reductase